MRLEDENKKNKKYIAVDGETKMEDYIPIEDLYVKQQEALKPKRKEGELTPFMKFGHAVFIVSKAIWFVITKTLSGIYNGLIKLNEGLDKARQSQTGKSMMEKYKRENAGFSFGNTRDSPLSLPPQQKGKKQKQQNMFGGW